VVANPDSGKPSPEAELRAFITRSGPNDPKLFESVRAALRKRFPTANELAYDYSSHVVIAYSSSDRGIDGVVAIDGRADEVRLYLMHGPQLPDPKKLLLGSGSQARFIRLETVRRLAHPDVKALVDAAVDLASVRLPAKGKGTLIIKSGAAKKPSRRRVKK
jgi:hypothetical protein